ncbi:alanine racemase [Frondihabitans australicus]|uniref:Alanine racemase n=1 Tax=Frondihabitans australicus TaxID=386892 RepID=A0A495IK34_9MICO|nr:alanine racemase [Frondihabitans australicus]RKR75475.1 alanine racemase [Frondihabitans australicus]
MTAEALLTIDTAALRHNIGVLRKAVEPAGVLAVVKANGYGHGAAGGARAFEDAGVDWLGVVDLGEAAALRESGISVPILAWLHAPGETFELAVRHDITPAISDLAQLEACAAAGVPVVHLCVDTGLSRNGAVESEWEALFDRAAALADRVRVEGIMSHLSNTSPHEDGLQMAAFVRAVGMLIERGITPPLQHLAASAAALTYGASRITMVRFGLAGYGLSPFDDRSSADLGLRPALTLTVPVVGVKSVKAGEGTSYGYTWRAPHDTTLALLPIGYADGVERFASNRASVLVGGRLRPVVGRIAMNALTVDLGADADGVAIGDEAVLFGDPAAGHPSVDDWARATGTINYEVVARLSPRLPRRYV